MASKTKAQTTTTTQSAQPWVEEQLKFATQEARNLYDQGAPDYYPGQTYVNFDPASIQAMDLTAQRALAGNSGIKAGQGMIDATLRGDFLNGNPNLSAAMDVANQGTIRNFQTSIAPAITGSFGRSGRYGSGAYNSAQSNAQQNLLTQIGNNNTNMAFQNYNAERQNQLAAAGLAPTYAAQDYVDAAQLGSVGNMKEAKAQEALAADMQRYDYNANKDSMTLDQLLMRLGQISPAAGGIGTSVTPVQKANPWSQALGLAATGAGMYFGGPMGGAAAGSMFGGLSGGGTGVSSWGTSPMSAAQSNYNGITWF